MRQKESEIIKYFACRSATGISLTDMTKINFTLGAGLPEDQYQTSNFNWDSSSANFYLDVLSSSEEFAGAYQNVLISLGLGLAPSGGGAASKAPHPCSIDLYVYHKEVDSVRLVATSRAINFCQQWKIDEVSGVAQEVLSFQKELRLQLGLIPVLSDDNERALQILVQANDVLVLSYVAKWRAVGIQPNRLYFPRVFVDQIIGGKPAPVRSSVSLLEVAALRVYKARPVFIESTVQALKAEDEELSADSNHFVIYFKLFDGCKQPTSAPYHITGLSAGDAHSRLDSLLTLYTMKQGPSSPPGRVDLKTLVEASECSASFPRL